jgi:hypothetical protein
MNKKQKITLLCFAIIYLMVITYLFTPTLNYGFRGFVESLIPFCIGILIWELKKGGRLTKVPINKFVIIFGSIGVLIISQFPFLLMLGFIIYTFYERKRVAKENRIRISKYVALAIVLYLVVLPIFTTSPLLWSKEYRNLIGDVKMGDDFTSKISPISNNDIRVVDEYIAQRLGDKVLGTVPAMGSQVEIGTFNIQSINNKLYWVAPLLHSGLLKWNKNKTGTTGYIMVSTSNERDVKLVQNYGDEPVLIKYQPKAYFSDNLRRHIYFNGFMTQGFTDYSFEIDNEGKPYWVVTLFKNRIGFGGQDATGVLLVDCKTGDIQEYNIQDAPKWVDRIQPADLVKEQLDLWGELVQGVTNFSDQNKLRTTNGISLVYGEGGNSYWYTGLTSVGADEGTVGFVLVDTRTKEATWYKQIGATEEAAQYSAQGKVQEKRYHASFPITYNINGIPTYVMSLKDQAGLVKMLAMVSVEDYTIVGVGNDFEETLRAYKNALHLSGSAVELGKNEESNMLRMKVSRIASDIRNGNTVYYLVLEGKEDKLFISSSQISVELPITQPGDSVAIEFDDDLNRLVDISSFDNLAFKQLQDN